MTQGILRRPRRGNGRMFFGVCAALANWTGINVFWWRLLFAIIALPGGLSIFIYFGLVLLIPNE